MRRLSEPEIIEGIRASSNEVLRYAYHEFFPVIRHMVTKNNGTHSDAIEVFQETLVVVYDKLRKGEGDFNCSLKTFIYAIGRNLWLQQLERSNRQIPFQEIENFIAEEKMTDYEEQDQTRKRIIQRHLLKMTDKCRQIIQLFLECKTYDEISEIMQFRSRQSAIKRKHECMKVLMNKIQNDPEIDEL